MAKDITMQVLTSTGYEPMYPFNPKQVLTASFLSSSTANQYNITINEVPVPLTNSFGNAMGIIEFVPTLNNNDNITLSINGDTAKPILFSDGSPVRANTLTRNRMVFVKYLENNFYLILDKSQIGLSNVDNTSDADKPVSLAVSQQLEEKLNTPVLIPRNSNLNNYTNAGMYYNPNTSDVSTIANAPSNIPFSLFVEKHAGVKQTFTNYSTSGIQSWIRNYYNGTWSNWYQVAIVLSGKNEPDNTIGLNGNIYLKYEN